MRAGIDVGERMAHALDRVNLMAVLAAATPGVEPRGRPLDPAAVPAAAPRADICQHVTACHDGERGVTEVSRRCHSVSRCHGSVTVKKER